MPKRRYSPEVSKLTPSQLRQIVDGIRDILWLDIVDDQDVYNPDKEQSLDTLDYVAGTLEDAALRPAREDASQLHGERPCATSDGAGP
jgi:hypothetical protein